MNIKTIVDEDFVNYKKPVMYIGTSRCSGKCCKEAGIPMSVCQNDGWRANASIEVDDDALITRYLNNGITSGICFAGLEPFEQFDEIYEFIQNFREEYGCQDDIVIYTGFNKHEIAGLVEELKRFSNIIIKFGRYVPNRKNRYDEVLGVTLVSDNQYAEKIS